MHGEYHHLVLHGKLAESMGWPAENVLVAEDGDVLEFTADSARMNGKVQCGYVFVDGLGVGDIGTVVLRDRKHLAPTAWWWRSSRSIARPATPPACRTSSSRGFVYQRKQRS